MRTRMNPDLEKLIRLQHAESALRRAEAELQEIPKHRAELEARVTAERTRLDTGREALAACQKARRQHESELSDLETKRSKYKGQLMDVKTNKEYTAMLHEIEGVEREIRGREDQILAEMERAETLAAEVKHEEAVFKDVEAHHKSDSTALEARARSLSEDAARLTAERDAIAATLPEDPLALFNRVARLRGAAVAEARDGMCQQCRVKLRPQMYVDLKHNLEIVQCPTCNRILYYVPPPPTTVSPEP
jgi:predicted  nucleic acid-binding Zn-ribbon protein